MDHREHAGGAERREVVMGLIPVHEERDDRVGGTRMFGFWKGGGDVDHVAPLFHQRTMQESVEGHAWR
jgi:hypothetical protein